MIDLMSYGDRLIVSFIHMCRNANCGVSGIFKKPPRAKPCSYLITFQYWNQLHSHIYYAYTHSNFVQIFSFRINGGHKESILILAYWVRYEIILSSPPCHGMVLTIESCHDQLILVRAVQSMHVEVGIIPAQSVIVQYHRIG